MDMNIRPEKSKEIARRILDDGGFVWKRRDDLSSSMSLSFETRDKDLVIGLSPSVIFGGVMSLMMTVDRVSLFGLRRKIVSTFLAIEGMDGFDTLSALYRSIG